MAQEEVNINVGGTLFITNLATLQKYPDTRLGSLSLSSEYYNNDKKYYFFDRNPEYFNTVLDFYRNGCIHFPSHICGWIWKHELEFWNIPAREISECCYSTYIKHEKDKRMSDYLHQAFTVQTAKEHKKAICWPKLRERIWLFLDEPSSSTLARMFSIFYLILVLLSSIIPILATHPSVREHFIDLNILIWWLKTKNITIWIDVNNPKEVQYITTTIPEWLQNVELSTTVFFSIESILRLITCPQKCRFFKNWQNILDIILFVTMWMRFILEQNGAKVIESFELTTLYSVCYCVVAFRLLRFFRITRQYSGLRILLMAIKHSLKELCLLLLTFMIFTILFSNMIYFAELRDPDTFPEMLTGFWWAVVTMTTVGYGDVTPKSPLGRVVGSVCAVSGLLVLAMPIAIIASRFNDLYQKNEDREDYDKLKNGKESTSFWTRLRSGMLRKTRMISQRQMAQNNNNTGTKENNISESISKEKPFNTAYDINVVDLT